MKDIQLKAKIEATESSKQLEEARKRASEAASNAADMIAKVRGEGVSTIQESTRKLIDTQTEAAKATAEAAKYLSEARSRGNQDTTRLAVKTAAAAAASAVNTALEKAKQQGYDLQMEDIQLKAKIEATESSKQLEEARKRASEAASNAADMIAKVRGEGVSTIQESTRKLIDTQTEAAKATAEAAKYLSEARSRGNQDTTRLAVKTAAAAAASAVNTALEKKWKPSKQFPELIEEEMEQPRFCRVIMPDASTTVVGTKQGQTINYVLGKLLKKRSVSIASVDVFLLGSEKPLNLNEDIAILGSKQVSIERRVLFRMELPNKKSIGVKAKPNRLIQDVFKPILNKYGFRIETIDVHLSGHSESLNLESLVSTIDSQRVIVLIQSEESTVPRSVLPPELLRMDSRSRDLYLKALGEGKTEVHNIRVMVVGHFDVGKTTLTKRLLGEEVNISDCNSTEGIDVHVKIRRVALKTGLWEFKSKDDDSSARLAKVVQNFAVTSHDDSLETPSGLGILNTDSSLDAGNLAATPDGLCEPDAKLVNSKGAAHSMNASLLSQKDISVRDDLKLLVNEDLSDINNYADLSIWDFAGQYAFYGTHQIFLSPRSVYILVFDLSKTIDSLVYDDTNGEKRMKVSEYVEFWLQSIYWYTEKEGMVILVGTHADKLAQEGRKKNVTDFFQSLRKHLCDKPYRVCLSGCDYYIDNSKVNPNLKELKEAIFNIAKSNTSHWGELKPAKWLTLERRLHEMRQEGVKIIDKVKFEEENGRLSVPLTEEELDLFLRSQHECGLLLYFSELKDYVILEPQWLIDAFKCFITAEMFMIKDMKLLPDWNSFKDDAILTQELIDSSWKQSKDRMFSEHKEHLLQLMEKLDIIAKPVNNREPEITDSSVFRIPEGSYFTPCMLKEKTPRSLLDTTQIPHLKPTHRLCYTFVSRLDSQALGFVPPAIFHRLIAACMSQWLPRVTNSKNDTKPLLFRDSVVFDLDSSRTHTLTLYLCDNFIQMWATSYSQNQPNRNKYIEARKQVECFLQTLYSNCPKMDMKTYMKCPKTDCCSSNGMIELSSFSTNLEYCCSMHEDHDHQILSAEVLCNWFVVDGPILDGIFLDRKPTDVEIATMAGRIGGEWEQLGIFLRLSQACIDRIAMVNLESIDKRRKMLIEWSKMFPHEATFRTLESALKLAGCDVISIFENFS